MVLSRPVKRVKATDEDNIGRASERMTRCLFCGGKYNPQKDQCTKCGLSNRPRMLVDKEIKALLKKGIMKILPILNMDEQLNPIGFDITLDTRFRKILKSNNTSIDPIEPYVESEYYQYSELLLSDRDDVFVLHPGEFTLGQSFEFLALPNYIGAGLDGKSSLGRLSLTVHTTAASIDPGFKGHITFELFNNGGLPIILRPLQPVARLIFHMTAECENPYSGPYSGQTEVRSSKGHETFFSRVLRPPKEDGEEPIVP
jgi:dCTP deaminase